MKQKIYWTYRAKRLTRSLRLNWQSLNWIYHPSFFLQWQFQDYEEAWLTKVTDWDQLIPNDKYTKELVPWVKSLSRLIIWEFEDTAIAKEDYENSIKAVWAEFQIKTFLTIDEVITWIKDNTNLLLKEWTTNTFVINEEYESMWEIIPAKYLIID